MEQPINVGERRSLKRSFSKMEREGQSAQGQRPHITDPRRPQQRTSRTSSLSSIDTIAAEANPHPRRRFAGDGFDYRRPITLPSQASIVDLTTSDDADIEVVSSTTRPSRPSSRTQARASPRRAPRNTTRLPRYPNPIFEEVIDLEAEPNNAPIEIDEDLEADNTVREPPIVLSSPEVTFISARNLPPRPPSPPDFDDDYIHPNYDVHPMRAAVMQHQRALARGHFPMHHLLSLVSMQPVLTERGGWPVGANPLLPPPPPLHHNRRTTHPSIRARPRADRRIAMQNGMAMPHQRVMNAMRTGLGVVGFNFVREEAQPAGPAYNPPPPVQAGFTRSPAEEDILICPKCGDELCKGESDTKQQAWVVKNCGHVYCGDCAREAKKVKKRGKVKQGEPRPFMRCVVDGCETSVTGSKAMVQLYL